MKEYAPERVRNIALAGHSGSGKTSLEEICLFLAGATDRAGKVDNGNTVADYLPEEIKRHGSVCAKPLAFEWDDVKFNFVDTPGFADFYGEVCAALDVCENVLLVAHAAHDLEIGFETTANRARHQHLPCFVFINQMDHERADFDVLFNAMRDRQRLPVVALTYPIKEGTTLKGFIDVLAQRAYEDDAGKLREIEMPTELAERVGLLREALIEAAVECDDSLMEKYLEGVALDDGELRSLLHRAVQTGCAVPVMCGSALKNVGIRHLLDTMRDMAISPPEAPARLAIAAGGEPIEITADAAAPFRGYVFKTLSDPFIGRTTFIKVVSGTLHKDDDVVNVERGGHEKLAHLYTPLGKKHHEVEAVSAGDIVQVVKLKTTATGNSLGVNGSGVHFDLPELPESLYTLAIEPATRGDDDKLNEALTRLCEEDQTFKVERNAETGQLLISGLGDVHLSTLVARLKSSYGVDVVTSPPRVAYRETIRKSVKYEGKLKKQSGGHGQFADVWIEVEPGEPGSGFQFVDRIVGGVVPRAFIPAVEEGVREALKEGPLAGYPLVDLKVTLYDGKYHDVDSSYQTFKIAGSMALRGAAKEASPVLLEPVMNAVIHVPEDVAGDVIGDLNSRRGQIMGMEPDGDGLVHIKAQVPDAELLQYPIALRSLTHGHGHFTKSLDHYDAVPENIIRSIAAAAA